MIDEEKLDKIYTSFFEFMESRQEDVEDSIALVQSYSEDIQYEFSPGVIDVKCMIVRFENKLTYMYNFWKQRYDDYDLFDLQEIMIELRDAIDYDNKCMIGHVVLDVRYHNDIPKFSVSDRMKVANDIIRTANKYIDKLENGSNEDVLLVADPILKEDYILMNRLKFVPTKFNNIFTRLVKKV